MPSIETYELLLAAAASAEDKKAEDIRILALDPTESGLTDYFLICNGTNDRQNVAITDEIEIRLKRDFNTYPNSVEGRRQGEWILMDYVDFIVHVFSAEKRAYYGLERLRKSATTISIAELNAELKARIAATRAKAPIDGFRGPCGVGSIVRHCLLRAGLDAPTYGAHQFRHGLATELLRQGASLGEIGELLGHRSLETTKIYAKVDLDALRTLALPWPGGVR